jgi:hypothetical protein
MPAIDVCEPEIIRALQKDGWQVLAKPHNIRLDERYLYADFRAGRFTAEGEQTIVVMEVKCFTDPKDDLDEIYKTIGQYSLYRSAMDAAGDSDLPLYLAIPEIAYHRFEAQPELWSALQNSIVKWLIVDTIQEVIFQWLN